MFTTDTSKFTCYSSRNCRGELLGGTCAIDKSGCCVAGGGLSYTDNATCQECFGMNK